MVFSFIKNWTDITSVIGKQINWKKTFKRKCTEILVIFRKSNQLNYVVYAHAFECLCGALIRIGIASINDKSIIWYYLCLRNEKACYAAYYCELSFQHVKLSKRLIIKITQNVTMTEHMAQLINLKLANVAQHIISIQMTEIDGENNIK